MRFLVTGASGMIGRSLIAALEADGHVAVRLVRRGSEVGPGRFLWNPGEGTIDADAFADVDVVINLAGEPLAEGWWTADKKRRIRDSRKAGTALISESMAKAAPVPTVLVSGSAVGFYGDRGDEVLDEASSPGKGFLADVCQQWEAVTKPATHAGVRVVLLRSGVVLHGSGGALAKMLPPFRMGIGGHLGSGSQYISWIGLPDAIRAIRFVIDQEAIRGAVNVVTPNAVTNAQFARMLGVVLRRPSALPVPAFALRLATGDMADAVLLASQRVRPTALLSHGFSFDFPDLESALRRVIE